MTRCRGMVGAVEESVRFTLVVALGLAGCPGFDSDSDSETDTDTDTDSDSDTGPACVEDTAEENDDAGTATPITTAPVTGTVCGPDEDWFAVAVPAECEAQLDLSFTHAEGDLDLEVWLAGVRIGRSGSTNDAESVRFLAPAASSYQVRVFGYGLVENAYTLVATLDCPICALDDGFEPNDDAGTAVPGTFPLLGAACPADPDWYTLPAAHAGCVAEYRLTSEVDVSRVQMSIADATGAAFGSASIVDGQSVLRAVVPADAKISLEASEPLDYSVEATTVCTSDLSCPDDEGVGHGDTPVYVAGGSRFEGTSCSDTGDVYAARVPAGCTLLVSANPGEGVMELTVRDTFGRTLATGEGAPANATFLAETALDAEIQAVAAGNGEVTYELSVDLVCP